MKGKSEKNEVVPNVQHVRLDSWQDSCGPIKDFLLDSSVTEIMVNGPSRVFIEQKGLLKKTHVQFKSNEELTTLCQAICAAVGRELSEELPFVDARLPDGSRINCVIPPVAAQGTALTIRKFSPHVLNHKQLIQGGTLDERMAYFISCAVAAKLNILVVGGTGSGKTTLLNVLCSFIPPHERLVCIEDSLELKIPNENTVRLESQPARFGQEPISIRSLVINALRMRPDRILVGECRGSEAFDMLVAMNTGHEGSMTTLHANSAREALRRLETMVMMADAEIPLKVLRHHISQAVDIVISIQRNSEGQRRVMEIFDVGSMEGDVIVGQEIFKYSSKDGFKASGLVPICAKKINERGVRLPADFFASEYKVKSTTG